MEDSEYEYYSMNDFQFPIRGYNIAQKFGNHSIIMNLELRLPFLLYYFPAIKYLGQIHGVLFIDAGVSWNDRFPSFSNQNNWNEFNNEGWIMSCGIGPRFYLFGMPWKLDYAWQYDPFEGKKTYTDDDLGIEKATRDDAWNDPLMIEDEEGKRIDNES